MLGKQWLNRYASTDMRGTTIERSQNRQRKLDGIVAWYFHHVMESLPLMLQIALLLLGCALSRYLWEINITVASVVLGVTAFGVLFYLFIVIAGTVFETCPYQTPSAHILRHAFRHTLCDVVLPTLRSAPSAISEGFALVVYVLSDIARRSGLHHLFLLWWSVFKRPWYSPKNIIAISIAFYGLLTAPFMVALFFGLMVPLLPVLFGFAMYRRLTNTPRTHALDQQTILDFRCISWMLQTSLDKAVRLPVLKHLEPLMSVPTDFDPALVVYCLNIFTSCINIGDCDVAVIRESEPLAMVSAQCFFHAISHLSVMDPTSGALKDVVQRYTKVFPTNIDFRGHQFSHIMNAVRRVFIPSGGHRPFEWSDYKPPSDEHAIVTDTLVKLIKLKYESIRQWRVPDWILCFTLHSLSLDPLPPKSVVADCLSIIAVDLDCDVSGAGASTLDERCVRVSQTTTALTSNQRASGGSYEPGNSEAQNADRS